MLHLLPMRWIVKGALVLTALAVFYVIVFDVVSANDVVKSSLVLVRWVLAGELVFVLGLYFLWPFFTPFKNRVYPHIAGTWEGKIKYRDKEGKPKEKPATLHICQNLFKIRLVLETDTSRSDTIIVRAERDADFSQFSLYYIFENKGRGELGNSSWIYNGTASISLAPGEPSYLKGAYYTDQLSGGDIEFHRQVFSIKGLWKRICVFVTAPKGVARMFSKASSSTL